MTQAPEVAQPVASARRITGFILVAMGAIICVRMAWLVAFYGSNFGREEWIRFAFWLWWGVVLTLTGCWLRFRWRTAGWIAVLAVPAFFGLVFVADRLGL